MVKCGTAEGIGSFSTTVPEKAWRRREECFHAVFHCSRCLLQLTFKELFDHRQLPLQLKEASVGVLLCSH